MKDNPQMILSQLTMPTNMTVYPAKPGEYFKCLSFLKRKGFVAWMKGFLTRPKRYCDNRYSRMISAEKKK